VSFILSVANWLNMLSVIMLNVMVSIVAPFDDFRRVNIFDPKQIFTKLITNI
jgi:hypothetical protein